MSVHRTQRERTLKLLRRAGDRGLTQLDVDGPALDGGTPIRRLAARVDELRGAGYKIERRGRRHRMAVYVLTAEPQATTVPEGVIAPDAAPPLFQPPPSPPRSAIDPWTGEQ